MTTWQNPPPFQMVRTGATLSYRSQRCGSFRFTIYQWSNNLTHRCSYPVPACHVSRLSFTRLCTYDPLRAQETYTRPPLDAANANRTVSPRTLMTHPRTRGETKSPIFPQPLFSLSVQGRLVDFAAQWYLSFAVKLVHPRRKSTRQPKNLRFGALLTSNV